MSTVFNDDPNAEFDALVAATESNKDELCEHAVSSCKPVKWVNTPAAYSRNAIKRQRQMTFLEAFKSCGIVSKACKIARVNPATQRNWHADAWYAQQFKDALQEFKDLIEEEIHNRAVIGEQVPIIGKRATPFGMEDQIIGYKTVKSDLLLMFHGKRHIPEYREKYEPPKDEKAVPTESPIARIMIRLDMIGQRQQVQIPTETVIQLPPSSSEDHVIDVQPDVQPDIPRLTEGTPDGSDN